MTTATIMPLSDLAQKEAELQLQMAKEPTLIPLALSLLPLLLILLLLRRRRLLIRRTPTMATAAAAGAAAAVMATATVAAMFTCMQH